MISPNRESSYDVVVIGGGPAGTTLASLLQRQGHRCLVLESSQFPRYHIGESLIPHTHGTFDRLGLLSKLRDSHFPVKHSVRFVSPSGKDAAPFYFSETIPGERAQTWQVERSEFDQICLENAEEAGVEVRQQTRVQKVLFEGDRAVGVRARTKDRDSEDVAARVVVDASGRIALLGTQLGLKTEVPALNKASAWTYYKGGKRGEGIDAGETTIFSTSNGGWCWFIPLPDDGVSVGIVHDPDKLFEVDEQFEEAFKHQLEQCPPLMERLEGAVQIEPVRGIRRLAYLNEQVVGDGWVMIGDAAGFLDPIYSSGLYLAMASAELAAGCIHEALETNDLSAEIIGQFTGPLLQGLEVIYRLIQAFYDPDFSFNKFAEQFPEQRAALIDCLVGDVVNKDLSGFVEALAKMTPPPAPLKA